MVFSRKTAWTATKYLLGLGLLAWVIWSNWDPGDGKTGLKQALQQPIYVVPLVIAAVLLAVANVMTFVRWYVLVRAQNLEFTVREAIRLGLAGFSLSILLPGAVGGDVIKAACLAREQTRRTVAVATVICDRILGLCSLFWLVAMLGTWFYVTREALVPAVQYVIFGGWGIAGGSLMFWFVVGCIPSRPASSFGDWMSKRIPKVGGILAELWSAVLMYRQKGKSILLAMAMGIVGHCGTVVAFYLSALAFTAAEQIPSFSDHFMLVPVCLTIQAGFPTPNGVGGSEYSYALFYAALAGENAQGAGVLASLAMRMLTIVLASLGYLVYLRMGSHSSDVKAVTPNKPEFLASATEHA